MPSQPASLQVTKEDFAKALRELGHNPIEYEGRKLTLTALCEVYELPKDVVIEAIDKKYISAHYDYYSDTIWVDALDAAHFYYCIRNAASIYAA